MKGRFPDLRKLAKTACLGLHPPRKAGEGWRLELDALLPAQRRATVRALLKAPLEYALHRSMPLGPAYEERPDVRAVRELSPPANEIDERMAELARAVMTYWDDNGSWLTLNESGVAQVAESLASDERIFDEEDLLACGAFVGEALRKQCGGRWVGFEPCYRLERGEESYDPLGWARAAYQRKGAAAGAQLLTSQYHSALSRPQSLARTVPRSDQRARVELEIRQLSLRTRGVAMERLLGETRPLSYRLRPGDWPRVLEALKPLLENQSGARALAALLIYAPADSLAEAWGPWQSRRTNRAHLYAALLEAMYAAVLRDDLEAMPGWPPAPRPGARDFLYKLGRRISRRQWPRIVLLLLRQRAAAGDWGGTAWCLYQYKREFPDCLAALETFCDMNASARQMMLRAMLRCTRDETRLFRPLWAEGLRDPSAAVVLAALEASNCNRARSLRPLIEALSADGRQQLAARALNLLRVWKG